MLLSHYSFQNHTNYIIVDSPLLGIGIVLFQIYNKGKLDDISYKSFICTTKQQKLCTPYREIFGIVYSLSKHEHIIFGSDYFFKVWKDEKPILTYFTVRRIPFSKILHCTNAITKFQKLRIFIRQDKFFL